MANNLTGDYDAVLLIGVTKINAILATLHVNGADEEASPTFPHSETTRVGDPPRVVQPPIADYAGWFNELLATLDEGRGGSEGGAGRFSDAAPPGASRALREAYENLQAARIEAISPPTGFTVRGTARVQLGAPSITLPPGSTSEVTVGVHVRAHYRGDPGTLALPEPIHGKVRVTCSVTVKPLQNLGSAKKVLEVRLPQDDSKIQFDPAPGTDLEPFEFTQLLGQIRKVVREGFEPVNTEVPADFPFSQFKELGGGQVLALPISLTAGVEPSAEGINTVTNNFLNEDFSIAIGKEFVEGFIDLDSIRESIRRRRITITIGRFGVDFDITYRLRFSSGPSLTWRSGAIDVSGRVEVETSTFWAPNGFVSFKQTITLEMNPTTKSIGFKRPLSDPEVDESWFIPHGRAVSIVKTEINKALFEGPRPDFVSVDDTVRNTFADARNDLDRGLRSVDDSASGEYSEVNITPDGVIVHGRISTKARPPAVVDFGETSDGTAFTAHKSWIPAGRITRFEWSWIMQNRFTPWGQRLEVSSDEHRFIVPKPLPGPGPFGEVLGDVCLRIEGVQVDTTGAERAVSAGEACSVSTPEVGWRMPPWSETMVTPVWLPDTPADGILEQSMAGHVSVLAHSRPAGGPTANSLVHFADPRMEKPLDALGQALARVRRDNAPLLVIMVLASGTFAGRRREVEARLGSLGEGFRGRLLLTEDYTGGWKRTFDTGPLPATYLMNARGEFVWKQEGALDGEELAAALDKHFTSGRAPRSRRLSLTVRPGDRAPRALFTGDRGQSLALRKLRGHRVLLNFWQSWSAPCIRELRRLQSLQDKGDGRAPLIVAVNGDQECEALSEVRRKYDLTLALVHDSRGLIARQFGVYCWPTTVSIARDGIVDGVQLGIAHEYRAKASAD